MTTTDTTSASSSKSLPFAGTPYLPLPASRADIPGIIALVDLNRGNLLPRSFEDMLELIDTTWVVREGDAVIGCVCLEIYSPKICELRTLAVHPDHQGNGLGGQLVQVAVDEAKRRNIPQILTVTSSPEWFERMNFGPCLKEKYALFYRG